MRYMTTCCGTCCTVQTGSRVLSILSLIGHVGSLVSAVLMTLFFDAIMEETRLQRQQEMSDFLSKAFAGGKAVFTVEATIEKGAADTLFSAVIAVAVFAAIGVVISSLFVHGAFKNKRYFILPHLVFNAVHILSVAILSIVIVVGQADRATSTVIISASVSVVITFCIQLYFYFVVLSFYKNLEYAERHPQPSVAYTAAPQSDPHAYPQQPQYYPKMPEKDGAV